MMRSNLDRISAQYGFSIIEISKEFKVDELKQELLNIFSNEKYRKINSLEDLKNCLEEIKREIENIEKRTLGDTEKSDEIKKLFENHYYRLFFLEPLKSKIDGELKKISRQDKNKYEPYNKTFEKLVRFINQQKFQFNAKDFDKNITRAIGILVEDGLSAYSVWLESEDEEPHRAMRIFSLLLLKDKVIRLIEKANDLREGVLEEISSNIQKTLLARQLLERMLTYARYRAKALQKGG